MVPFQDLSYCGVSSIFSVRARTLPCLSMTLIIVSALAGQSPPHQPMSLTKESFVLKRPEPCA
jgi:hypothetical protein